jgi:hypothetical protein
MRLSSQQRQTFRSYHRQKALSDGHEQSGRTVPGVREASPAAASRHRSGPGRTNSFISGEPPAVATREATTGVYVGRDSAAGRRASACPGLSVPPAAARMARIVALSSPRLGAGSCCPESECTLKLPWPDLAQVAGRQLGLRNFPASWTSRLLKAYRSARA